VSTSLQFLLALSLLIAGARLGAVASKRLGQPAVLGELLAGVLFGPTLLNFFQLPWFTGEALSETVKRLADLGVIFLMFLAGLEVDLGEMFKTGRAAALAGVGGVAGTLVFGLGAGLLFKLPSLNALFLGIALSATSVGISAQTLMELGVLRRRESLALLGAAVMDDILVLLILSIFLALTTQTGEGWAGVGLVLVRLALYLALAAVVAYFVLPRLALWAARLSISQGLVSLVVVVTLLYAWAAEALGGIAAVTGAFLAGLALARSPLRQEIEHRLGPLIYGVFVPLFFVSIGLQTDLRALTFDSLWRVLLMLAAVVSSKLIGGGLGAWRGGLTPTESLRLGLGMISRGEVVLIVASVGLAQQRMSPVIFAELVLVVLATTVLTPLLLRRAYGRDHGPAPRG
jgi:Kef-type K+ transport system membrane component KefB